MVTVCSRIPSTTIHTSAVVLRKLSQAPLLSILSWFCPKQPLDLLSVSIVLPFLEFHYMESCSKEWFYIWFFKHSIIVLLRLIPVVWYVCILFFFNNGVVVYHGHTTFFFYLFTIFWIVGLFPHLKLIFSIVNDTALKFFANDVVWMYISLLLGRFLGWGLLSHMVRACLTL